MENIVHEPFTFFVGKPSPVQSPLPGQRDEPWLQALNGPVESRGAGDQAQHGLAPSLRGQTIQAVEDLLFADFNLRHADVPRSDRANS